jgi:hypothetical protein
MPVGVSKSLGVILRELERLDLAYSIQWVAPYGQYSHATH